MKITYISRSRLPSRDANSIQVINMCAAFAQSGAEVTLLAPNRPGNVSTEQSIFEYYGVTENFDIKMLAWNPLKDYQYIIAAANYCRKADPDIVYGRSIAGCYFASLTGCPVVYESHLPADQTGTVPSILFSQLIRRPEFNQLVVISNQLRQYYLNQYNINSELITVAHDAAPIPDNKKSVDLSNGDQFLVGYVGHLYEGKGMEIIAELVPKCPWADFHIVGGTDEDIAYWKRQLAPQENVTFHGFVDPSSVSCYHRAVDVLLAPYQRTVYGSLEGTDLSKWMSPLKLFEYMAAERPIICSDLPVLNEVLEDGKNALLRDPDDIERWVNAIQLLNDDQRLRSTLASNARKDFKQNYSYEARAQLLYKSMKSKKF